MDILKSTKNIVTGGKVKYLFANPLVISIIITIIIVLMCIIFFYKYITLKKMLIFSLTTVVATTSLIFIENILLSKKDQPKANSYINVKNNRLDSIDEALSKPYNTMQYNTQYNTQPTDQESSGIEIGSESMS